MRLDVLCSLMLTVLLSPRLEAQAGQEPSGNSQSFQLPPVPDAPGGRLATTPRIYVVGFQFSGNTMLDDDLLAEVTRPWTNREITTEELSHATDAVTRAYVERAFVNSGATVPDQDVADGIINIVVIEGSLGQVDIENSGRFRDGYILGRLTHDLDRPLNVADVERRLRLVQQDPRIKRLTASLKPGIRAGEADLFVRVEESRALRTSVEVSNYQSPSVGEERLALFLAHENVSGNGDVVSGSYRRTRGLNAFAINYAYPITAKDTLIGATFRDGDSVVTETPFERVDIGSVSRTFGVFVTHPVIKSPGRELVLGVTSEYRLSQTFLLGKAFSFSSGAEDGEAAVMALRASQEWTQRSRAQVLALRSSLSFGVTAFGATDHAGLLPDGRFISWLGRFQWARRLGPMAGELVVRTDTQLASDSLLSIEQFAIGGHASVRGFRENQIVRDMGVFSSAELRLAVLRSADGSAILQLAPFFDFGRGWNKERSEFAPTRNVASAGVGARWHAKRWLYAEIYWAAWRSEAVSGSGIQDEGIQFQLRLGTW